MCCRLISGCDSIGSNAAIGRRKVHSKSGSGYNSFAVIRRSGVSLSRGLSFINSPSLVRLAPRGPGKVFPVVRLRRSEGGRGRRPRVLRGGGVLVLVSRGAGGSGPSGREHLGSRVHAPWLLLQQPMVCCWGGGVGGGGARSRPLWPQISHRRCHF